MGILGVGLKQRHGLLVYIELFLDFGSTRAKSAKIKTKIPSCGLGGGGGGGGVFFYEGFPTQQKVRWEKMTQASELDSYVAPDLIGASEATHSSNSANTLCQSTEPSPLHANCS